MTGKRKSAMTLRELWQAYRAALPAQLPPLEERKAELAFYAGAANMLEVLHDIGADDVGEDEGVDAIERLNQELRTWALTQLPARGRPA